MASSTADIHLRLRTQGSSNTMGVTWTSINQELIVQYSGGENYVFYDFTLLDFCDLLVSAKDGRSWDTDNIKVKGILSSHLSERIS